MRAILRSSVSAEVEPVSVDGRTFDADEDVLFWRFGTMPETTTAAARLYTAITRERGAWACNGISDEACQSVPRNFLLFLSANTLTKVGDRIASPKTTLAWLLQAIGAPAFLVGLIVPIRESGSMVPQVLVSRFVRTRTIRKWIWVGGSVAQGLAIAGMAAVAAWYARPTGGWLIVSLTVVFSLARCLCSVASKDVQGKTIPKTRRGLLNGWMNSASGILAILAGLLLFVQEGNRGEPRSMDFYLVCLSTAAILWVVAAVLFGMIREFAGEADHSADSWSETIGKLKLLRDEADFRNFVIARALAIGSGLSVPFVISLAHRDLGGVSVWLGVFIVIDGLAAMISAPVWGRWADRSSRRVMLGALVGLACLLVATTIVSWARPSTGAAMVAYPILFFLLCVVHSGVRIGRKTYLVDMAEGNRRTEFVTVSNTVIGIILLFIGALTGLVSLLSIPVVLAVFAICSIAGVLMVLRLPEVSG